MGETALTFFILAERVYRIDDESEQAQTEHGTHDLRLTRE